MKKSKNSGSTFDSFLKEEGLLDEVEARVAKRMFLEQLTKAMKAHHKNKTGLRRLLGSPTTVSRLFDEKHTGTALLTLVRVADYVGKEVEIRLVDRRKKRSTAAAS